MNKDLKNYRFWVALTLAPLVAPLLFALTWINPSEFEFTVESLKGFVTVIAAFYVLGTPIAYVVTLLVGIPVFRLLKQRDWVGFVPVSIAGTGIAAFLFLFVWLVWTGFSFTGGAKTYLLFLPGAVLGGFGVSATFWLIYVRRTDA